MKNSLPLQGSFLAIIFLFTSFTSYTQIEKFFQTDARIPIREISDEEIKHDSLFGGWNIDLVVIPEKTLFRVLQEFNDDYCIIQLGEYKNNAEKRERFNYTITTSNINNEPTEVRKEKYFLIRKADLGDRKKCVAIKPKGYYGSQLAATTIPFKIRVQNFDFYTSQTLGLALNFKWKVALKHDFYFNWLTGLNFSLNNLDSFSTRGIVNDQPINNVGALSPMTGFVFQLKNVQAGLMIGIDLMNKQNMNKYHWVYNARPWIGIGLGISIISNDAEKIGDVDLTQRHSR
ncbi:MAG TPA: hypothetical protein VHM26_13405 [Chitinophagaceae bacterium]|jgi:hypothetical protein|nr:hypothetical protein [Chitinophagaceae bacterium]